MHAPLFPELPFQLAFFPPTRHTAPLDIPMERGKRPRCRVVHQTVLDGIEPAILHMVRVIRIVANVMFPVSPLPDASLCTDIEPPLERLAAVHAAAQNAKAYIGC